ncbi:transposase family protein [Streptomyces sp. AD16]|nr:transposase family protein [Streptomyces sp. AD16]
MVDRNALAHPLFTGLFRHHLACLAEELADPWQAEIEDRRHEARGGAGKREAGAGARHRLVFVDRLVVTLIHLRHDLPHSGLALLSGVDRSTVTRAIKETHRLLAKPGRVVPDRPGLRLRTLADVFAYAPVQVLRDGGYLGLRRDHPGQAITPPREPDEIALPRVHAAGEARHDTHRSASPSSTRLPTTRLNRDHAPARRRSPTLPGVVRRTASRCPARALGMPRRRGPEGAGRAASNRRYPA